MLKTGPIVTVSPVSRDNLKIRPLKKSDISSIVEMHIIAFPGFFMTLMGKRFLVEYYNTVFDYEYSINLIATNNSGESVGFAVGFKDPTKFYKFLKSRFYNFITPTIYGFLRQPHLILKIFMGFVRVNNKKIIIENDSSCELSSIGAIKQGLGCGSSLLKQFIEEARIKNSSEIILTTDMNNNDNVVKFYISNGFTQADIENRGNRPMIKFIFTLNDIS